MLYEFIAVIAGGFAGGGLAMLLNQLSGRRLPSWVTPVAAGIAMLAVAISNEYGWYTRTIAALPDQIVVAQTVEDQAIYRPWTYAVPYISRFVAIDRSSVRTHQAQPDQAIMDLFFFARWSPVHIVPVLFDCAGNRQAPLTDEAVFATDGTVQNAQWEAMPPDNPVLQTACAEV